MSSDTLHIDSRYVGRLPGGKGAVWPYPGIGLTSFLLCAEWIAAGAASLSSANSNHGRPQIACYRMHHIDGCFRNGLLKGV